MISACGQLHSGGWRIKFRNWRSGGSGFWGELPELGFLMRDSGDLVLARGRRSLMTVTMYA